MERLMLKPAEAAEAIGMGRTAFYRLVKAGLVPSCRVGKSIRIPALGLREWVEKKVAEGSRDSSIPTSATAAKVAGQRVHENHGCVGAHEIPKDLLDVQEFAGACIDPENRTITGRRDVSDGPCDHLGIRVGKRRGRT